MKRRIALSLLVLITAVSGLAAPSGSAEPGTTPYIVDGVVSEVQPATFDLVSLTNRSDTISGAPEPFRVTITPATKFYNYDDSGQLYRTSTYGETVAVGEDVRVYGRFSNDVNTAIYVWNPPPPPTEENYGKDPVCGQTGRGLTARPFVVEATIRHNRTKLPCTGIGELPGGFLLEDGSYDNYTGGVDQAITDYGGVVAIYEMPGFTEYIANDQFVDRSQVVFPGKDVRIYGRYHQAFGGWYMVARYVWAPPPEVPDEFVAKTDILQATSSDGSAYSGKTAGQNFNPGDYTADIVWTPASDGGWDLSGTWELRDTYNHLAGTMTGVATPDGRVEALLTVTSAGGVFAGYGGGGSMLGTGSSSPVAPPSTYRASISITLAQ